MQQLLNKLALGTYSEFSQLTRNITVVISNAQCQIMAVSRQEHSIAWAANHPQQTPPAYPKCFIEPVFHDALLNQHDTFAEADAKSLQAIKSLLGNNTATRALGIGSSRSGDPDTFCMFLLLFNDAEISQNNLTSLLNALKQDILKTCSDYCEVRLLNNLVKASTVDTISQIEKLTEFNQKLTDNINDALVVIDHKGEVISANRMVESLLGYTEAELLGKNVSVLMPAPYASAHDHYLKHYIETRQAQIIGRPRELPAKHKSGDTVHIELTLTEVEHQQQTWFVGMMRDLTERKNHEARMRKMAYEDPITGLPNLQAYHRDSSKWLSLANTPESYLYVSIIDIDRFSEVNLAYGREKGDHVLAIMAKRILAICGQEFVAYRGLGDSFIIARLAPLTSPTAEDRFALTQFELSLQASLENNIDIEGHQHQKSVSIGSIFKVVDSDETPESLLSLIDYTRAEIKSAECRTIYRISHADYQSFERQKNIRRAILPALTNNEFHVVLQPKVNAERKVMSSELLIRWNSPELGAVRPDEFIPIAEISSDIHDITKWVLEQACINLAEAKKYGQNTQIAINVSARDIVRPVFEETIMNMLRRYNLRPQQLILELTETALIQDLSAVSEKLKILSDYGLKISIDDFGTAYSSMINLYMLPISELKIDRIFTLEMEKNFKAKGIVESLLALSKRMQISTVAEGVETAQQVEILEKMGCDLMQGYYFARPLPPEEWLAFLLKANKSTDETIANQ